MLVAGIATGRALAFNNSVKIIDSPNGQGKRAQYKYRWGVEVWQYKGIVPVINYGSTLSTVSATALSIEAPESQTIAKLSAPSLTDATTKMTWSAITHAGSYIVYLNGVEKARTTSTEYTYGSDTGDFTVVAVSKNYAYTNSDPSTAITVS